METFLSYQFDKLYVNEESKMLKGAKLQVIMCGWRIGLGNDATSKEKKKRLKHKETEKKNQRKITERQNRV